MFKDGKRERVTFTRKFPNQIWFVSAELWGIDNFVSMLRYCRKVYSKDILWSFSINNVVIVQSKEMK